MIRNCATAGPNSTPANHAGIQIDDGFQEVLGAAPAAGHLHDLVRAARTRAAPPRWPCPWCRRRSTTTRSGPGRCRGSPRPRRTSSSRPRPRRTPPPGTPAGWTRSRRWRPPHPAAAWVAWHSQFNAGPASHCMVTCDAGSAATPGGVCDTAGPVEPLIRPGVPPGLHLRGHPRRPRLVRHRRFRVPGDDRRDPLHHRLQPRRQRRIRGATQITGHRIRIRRRPRRHVAS